MAARPVLPRLAVATSQYENGNWARQKPNTRPARHNFINRVEEVTA
jgi:hypothetical protein